ncbi:aromatic oxygenase [Sphingobium sp. TA15]|uniref:Large subunit of anthranilate dioxygenase n=2 Tax=Sphingobium indicum TaxID=332055 RepID=D4Z424_SPHIU|nr:anthranilate 1,2-dioxygenase large subunit AndAc [Sphingobium indicum]NYI21946.1 anthranilate 1,2-dioxygenase large subunit [Sphingobium indicum]RYM03296.1 Rieske (2Fe-2S) protein [Sphingobium indicum]BAI97356.1 large subunit of anthranilate dioxygenase [Sphingobium indicum UT26S]BDD66772.1 aromatic oxygenase [Sphingobium sp. TA15]
MDSVIFPASDGSRIPYKVFSSQEIYDREQERIYRGPTWNFLGLAAELPNSGDFKSTFVGDTPVVMTRTEDGDIAAWVNRCAHRGAMVCRLARGNAKSHDCVYHQWSYDTRGNLIGVPFRRGQNGADGMPSTFKPAQNGLRQLRVEEYRGLVFATFSDTVGSFAEYLGPEMLAYVDRVFHKPVEYLGCTRQYSNSNWKLYLENVKDPYHASLLHMFHTTFNIFRVGMKAHCETDRNDGLHSIIMAIKEQADTELAYKEQAIRSYDEGFRLEDDSLLALVPEFDLVATNHIQPVFPQLVIQQIHNTLVARQLLPKGPDNFELIFHFFGYADDTPELRALRIKQANLVGPAGYISMEDTEATELVQQGTVRDGNAHSVIEMAKNAPSTQTDTLITENLIRSFWKGYQKLMDFPSREVAA